MIHLYNELKTCEVVISKEKQAQNALKTSKLGLFHYKICKGIPLQLKNVRSMVLENKIPQTRSELHKIFSIVWN